MSFVKIGRRLINASQISSVDLTGLIDGVVTVKLIGAPCEFVYGPEAIDLVMVVKPSALEGQRLKWPKRAWMIHNLIGHPGMQLLALLGYYDLAMRLHEITIPRPASK